MIKFVATQPDGSQILFVGLSAGNLEALPKDLPIVIDLAEIGLGRGNDVAEIVIFSGGTEQEMMAQVVEAGLIKPDTDVKVDPRLL